MLSGMNPSRRFFLSYSFEPQIGFKKHKLICRPQWKAILEVTVESRLVIWNMHFKKFSSLCLSVRLSGLKNDARVPVFYSKKMFNTESSLNKEEYRSIWQNILNLILFSYLFSEFRNPHWAKISNFASLYKGSVFNVIDFLQVANLST